MLILIVTVIVVMWLNHCATLQENGAYNYKPNKKEND